MSWIRMGGGSKATVKEIFALVSYLASGSGGIATSGNVVIGNSSTTSYTVKSKGHCILSIDFKRSFTGGGTTYNQSVSINGSTVASNSVSTPSAKLIKYEFDCEVGDIVRITSSDYGNAPVEAHGVIM